MTNIAAARSIFSLSSRPTTDEGKKVSLAEAKLIEAALVVLDKIGGDGLIELSNILYAGKKANSFGEGAQAYLENAMANKSALERVTDGLSDKTRLLAMNDAFDSLYGPNDATLKPMSDVQLNGLPTKTSKAITSAMRITDDLFAQNQEANEEYSFDKAVCYAMRNDAGQLLGYAVFGHGGWDTQTEGRVSFIAPDGLHLAAVESEQ